jgi:tetratricopeptide (TPR) repeat protein
LSSFKDLTGMMGKAATIGMAAVMMAAAAVLPAWAASATPALIAEVQSALDKGDAQQAATLAEAGLKEWVTASERGRLLLYRGLARELLGASAEAMRDFTQALDTGALPPDERAQALLQRGFLRDGLGRLDEAAADYTAVIALKGETLATALNNRANIYRRENKLPQARSDYLAALSAGSAKPQYSWYGLGQIAEAGRDTNAARGFYAKAMAADPSYGLATDRLAALGGPPDGAIPDPAPVVLHPPPPVVDGKPARGIEAAAKPPTQSGDNIVLHAPRVKNVAKPITLHSPATGRWTVAAAEPRSARTSRRANGLILRPALDQQAQRAGGAEAQLGAWRSEAEANAGWQKAKARAGGTLDGLAAHVVSADLPGKGRYFRLRTVPAAGHRIAEFCATLTAKGIACLPARD